MKKEKGITLIALVVTIIVLLILAGIAINLSIGNNGLFSRAKDSKKQTEIAVIKERAGTDILGAQADNKSGDITKEQLVEILETYFENVPEAKELPEDLSTVILTAKKEYGGHEIKASDIYDGGLAKEQETIAKSESYVGYYADFQKADGSDGSDGIPDGIIYADLAVGGSGTWNNDRDSGFEYEAVSTGLKEYYISQTGYNGTLGINDVLSPIGVGADRFYVMALEDVNPGTSYCWYDAAEDDGGKLDKIVDSSTNDFGEGRENTRYVMDKWDKGTNEGGWGAQNDNETYADLWGAISNTVKPNYKWFVPSKSEWSAFGDMMYTKYGMTTSNYGEKGLNGWYWTSSQKNAGRVFLTAFYDGWIDGNWTSGFDYVRLSTTF